MSCKACDEAIEKADRAYPYRIGNEKIGWGTLMLVGCREHVKFTMEMIQVGTAVTAAVRTIEP